MKCEKEVEEGIDKFVILQIALISNEDYATLAIYRQSS